MAKDFGENLKDLLMQKNLSVTALAKAIGVSPKTAQEWVGTNARVPRDTEVLRKLSEFFKVSTHYILFGEEDPRGLLGEILEKTELHTGLYEVTIRKVKAKKGIE